MKYALFAMFVGAVFGADTALQTRGPTLTHVLQQSTDGAITGLIIAAVVWCIAKTLQ
jgi:hypothetical protein